MKQYLDLLQDILENGTQRQNRTGVDVLGVFGRQLRFNLQEGFPLLTTKKVHMKSIIHELLWFIKGDTNVKYLHDNGVTIWDEWADERGNLGPIYGKQWRQWDMGDKWPHDVDQLADVIDRIKTNPTDRRLLVSAWNPSDIPDMALPPCHYAFQFYVNDGKLSCMFQMRSVDTFLGLPFNIASYALLTHIIAMECKLGLGELIWTGGDVHIYFNHLDQVHEQLSRKPRHLPILVLRDRGQSWDQFEYDDFILANYKCWPAIKAPVAK